jgi:tripartite-type tricarboxylate transporter receptor subunit TctC
MNKNQGASGAATLTRRWPPPIAVLLVAELCFTNAAFAQNAVEEFYKGKQFNLIVGYGPGGGYDITARLVARYLGKYIPGQPNVVVQNMPGAGSMRAANYVYVNAPKTAPR